ALSAYCAIYIALFTFVATTLWGPESGGFAAVHALACSHEQPGTCVGLRDLGYVVVFPLVWVGFEYLRASLFTGFPWNALGISQYANLPVIQVAEWGGVYAVSAIIVMFNTAFARVLLRLFEPRRGGRRWQFQIELAASLAVLLFSWWYGLSALRLQIATGTRGIPLRIAAVQPNIPQLKKWTPEFAGEICETLEVQTDSLLRMNNRPDLIIWPETAVPAPVLGDRETNEFVRKLADRGVPLLVGSMELGPASTGDEYYNSSFLFDGKGGIVDRYRKRHLVPFGEYIPLAGIFPGLRKLAPLGFSCREGRQVTLFPLSETFFSVLICFEDAFPELAWSAVRAGARLLVNQTNDAWFDPAAGSLQHMTHCVFRCVENRVPAVRAANTGVTCVIMPWGLGQTVTGAEAEDLRCVSSDPWGRFVRTNLVSTVVVPDATMRLTFYARYGDVPFALPCGVGAALATLWIGYRSWKMSRKIRRASEEGGKG
ncbi:MAG: apolipoprotein N-acyltransferase, partial [Kiritimatiellae bacterium]|nr:apolipoprotein N-acyltransferase [Kiritimatiellia bacterium]